MADDATKTEPGTDPTTPPAPPEGTPPPPAPPAEPKTYDEDYVKKLRSESAGYRTSLRDVEQARDAALEEAKTFKAKLEEADAVKARATDLESQVARLSVALEKGLPKDLVSRLVGTTPEELAADADSLLALVGPRGPVGFDQGGRTPVTPPDLATQIAEAEKAGNVALSIALKARQGFTPSA